MANGIYNCNTPQIPGNGADLFGDKLVGNQFTDGTSQFTLGNFGIYSNAAPKDSREFSLGNFSEPITLDTLQIEDVTQAKLYASNSLEVFINFDRSKVSNYTLYGSLRERIKVAVQNVIKKFPAAMLFNNVRTWSDYNTGDTAVNIIYEPSDNQTYIDLNLYTIYNPFSIDYTKQAKDTLTSTDSIELRNLVLSFKRYALFYKNNEYPLQYLKSTSGNTEFGFLTIAVDGKPFGNSTGTTESFYIKPTTTETEKAFDKLNDMEKFLVERKSTPKYTAKFQQPTETDSGKIIQATKSITWPTTDFWNIRINGELFEKYLEDLYDIGDSFDSYKTNLISRFLTTAAFKEFDTVDEKVDKVLKIYGRSFDVIKKYIDGLAYMTNVSYDGVDNLPNTLLKNFARTLGWKTPSAIEDKGFLDSIFSRNPDILYEGQATNPTPAELDTELYRRLLVNTAYLFKSKGTRKSIEFMLRFIGAPEALIEFNEYVYVAGAPINMKQFNQRIEYISGGTYTEEVPVRDSYFTELSGTFPPITITGFTYGYKTVTKETKVGRYAYPVDEKGYPTKPRYGPDAYYQAGAGWFEETTEHRGKRVVDTTNSVFTGNTPVLKTKLNKFTYGEPYLDLYRKFPDMNIGFPIVRTPDNKKSWVKKDTYNLRQYNLRDRGTYYYTSTDKLVLNVKNVELYLNVGQGLEWDVWNLSKRYDCPFGPTALSSPYPGMGGPDWTEIVVDASKVSFFEFTEKFWRILINVKNRLTIDDGHGGGYPTLLNIYLNYLDSENVCGVPSNKYTYEKMIAYVENLGDYWIRLVEQFIPATTIWTGGIKYENSIFHRDKFVYKHEPLCDDKECFGSFATCCEPIFNDILVEGVTLCGGLLFTGATWQNKIILGGEEYVGDIYYSSTTIYDIPDTSDWLGDMVSILSGITQDVNDPNHLLNYYLINDITDPNIPGLTDPNCIIIQGPCGTGEPVCDCPSGYTFSATSVDGTQGICIGPTVTGTTATTTVFFGGLYSGASSPYTVYINKSDGTIGDITNINTTNTDTFGIIKILAVNKDNADNLVSLGQSGLIKWSNNGGSTWNTPSSTTPSWSGSSYGGDPQGIAVDRDGSNSDVWIAGGGGVTWYSSDGGQNYTQQTSFPTPGGVFLQDSVSIGLHYGKYTDKLYALTTGGNTSYSGGTILASTTNPRDTAPTWTILNGGIQFSAATTGMTYVSDIVEESATDLVILQYLIDDAGNGVSGATGARASYDEGLTFDIIQPTSYSNGPWGIQNKGGQLYMYGHGQEIKKLNSIGPPLTWTTQSPFINTSAATIMDMTFISPLEGYSYESFPPWQDDWQLYHTTDGGITKELVVSASTVGYGGSFNIYQEIDAVNSYAITTLTAATTCVTYPKGNDAWNANNGVDPHYFTSEICLNIQQVQVVPLPDNTDIYAFYDTSSTPIQAATAASLVLDRWINGPTGIRATEGFTGNLFHIPLANERWLQWATIPISGGTYATPRCVIWQAIAVLPPSTIRNFNSCFNCNTAGNYTFPSSGTSTDVLLLNFVDETAGRITTSAYHGARGGANIAPSLDNKGPCAPNSSILTGSPPGLELNPQYTGGGTYSPNNDWNAPSIKTGTITQLNQPTSAYTWDFTAFTAAHSSYNTFKGFVYPIIYNDWNENMMFPLHVYGAMYSGTVDPSQLIENPTITAVGGTLTAITISNPYSVLTATNTNTGYVGAGLNNFGWGAKLDLGAPCGVLPCAGGSVNTCVFPCFDDNQIGNPPYCPLYNAHFPCGSTPTSFKRLRCSTLSDCPQPTPPSTPQYGCLSSTAYERNVCTDPAMFFNNGQFQNDLFDFLQGSVDISIVSCEICLLTCGTNITHLWETGAFYEDGDIVTWDASLYEWNGESSITTPVPTPPPPPPPPDGGPPPPPPGPCCFPPGCTCNSWVFLGAVTPSGIPFLGGNNFTEGDDCDPYEEIVIPENPTPTGYTYTVDPVTFKNGIFNVGGQDCFESKYKPCEEMVDPCACTPDNTQSEWDTNAILHQPGNIVCCPEGTFQEGVTWIMLGTDGCQDTPFDFLLCAGWVVWAEVNGWDGDLCWHECSTSDEILFETLTNDTEDACNPDSPSVEGCECQETDSEDGTTATLQSIDLEFFRINVGDVPDQVQMFRMEEENLEKVPSDLWVNMVAGWSPPPDINWYKAILTPCCLADNFIFHFLRYIEKSGNWTPEFTAEYTLNITDSTQLDFYMWRALDAGEIAFVRYYLHIPNMDNMTITEDVITTNNNSQRQFRDSNSLVFQLGGNSYGWLGVDNYFYLQKLIDSNYLTDNGNTVSPEIIGDIPDRYWFIIPEMKGALSAWEMNNVVWHTDQSGIYNFQTNDPNARYNMELQVGCNGRECTYLQFNVSASEQLFALGNVPITNSCPTNLGASSRQQTGIIKSTVVDFAKGNVTGNRLEVDIEGILLKNQTELNVNDYEIINSQLYLTPTRDPLKSSAPQQYNNPKLVGTTTGPTSQVFETEEGKEVTYLGEWLDNIETQTNRNTVVSFTTPSDLKQFGISLRKKSIAGGTEKVGPSIRTYSNYEDWAMRCIGLTNGVFNPKTINYNSDGEFDGFTLTPQLKRSATNSQKISGESPLPTGNNSIILTTQGPWEDYLETQTGTTLSAFTSIVYSAYTNLSAYTDTSETKVSADQVHDICVVGNNINLSTQLFYSDRILLEPFKFINNTRGFIPFVPPNALWTNCGPYYVDRTPSQYSYYQATEDICLRARLTTTINIQYQDPTWWNYLDKYKTLTKDKGDIPSNDYEYYSLLNSAIINGNSNILRPTSNTEGTFVNSRTTSNTYFPVDGFNANSGILDFQVRISIQKSLSGITSATTTLATYIVGANETDNANADTFLTVPVNKTEENKNTYNYTSITANSSDNIIIEKNIIASLDTGTIRLSTGERLFAYAQIESLTTPKWTSTGTTATTMTVRLGTNTIDSDNPESPYFLITEVSCIESLASNVKLYWDSNDITKQITPLYINGQVQPINPVNEMGALYSVPANTNNISTDYRTEPITLSNLLSFSYMDLANTSETLIDNTTLFETSKKTNNWVKKIESGESSNLKINADKMITFNNLRVQFNLPVSKDTSTPMLSNPEYMYVLETTLRIKGTKRVFPLISLILPEATQSTNKLNITVLSTNILGSLSSSSTSSNIEDVNIDTIAGHVIINDEVINVESSYYDIIKPSLTYGRKAYYKCGTNTFVEVSPKDSIGAQGWCCATQTTPEYYPCGEKTRSEWIKVLGKDVLKYGGIVTENNVRGIVLGTSKNNKTYGGGSQCS